MNKYFIDVIPTPPNAECYKCGEPAVVSFAADSDEGHRDERHFCEKCRDEMDRQR